MYPVFGSHADALACGRRIDTAPIDLRVVRCLRMRVVDEHLVASGELRLLYRYRVVVGIDDDLPEIMAAARAGRGKVLQTRAGASPGVLVGVVKTDLAVAYDSDEVVTVVGEPANFRIAAGALVVHDLVTRAELRLPESQAVLSNIHRRYGRRSPVDVEDDRGFQQPQRLDRCV